MRQPQKQQNIRGGHAFIGEGAEPYFDPLGDGVATKDARHENEGYGHHNPIFGVKRLIDAKKEEEEEKKRVRV
jgi:hypothetical protein